MANILKNLLEEYTGCESKSENVLKSGFVFGKEEYDTINDNFEEKYNDILDFRVVGHNKTRMKSRYKEPESSSNIKFQQILDSMAQNISIVVKHIFKNLVNDSRYTIQMMDDDDWCDIGLKGYRGLHWYYTNRECPSEQYIEQANKWISEKNKDKNKDDYFIKELKSK